MIFYIPFSCSFYLLYHLYRIYTGDILLIVAWPPVSVYLYSMWYHHHGINCLLLEYAIPVTEFQHNNNNKYVGPIESLGVNYEKSY